MKNIDKEFKQWKMKKLNEGFLDNSPETTPSAENTESIVQSYEAPEETTDAEELVNTTVEEGDDITQSPVEEQPEENTEELKNTDAEEKTEGEDVKTEISSIKDAIAALASQIQTLVDQKAQEEAPAEQTTEEMSEPTEGSSEGESTEGSTEGSSEGESTEGSSEGSSEGESTEGSSEGSTEGEGEGDSIVQSPEDESDETKSEAYNLNMKAGRLLNSKSNSIISKVAHQRLWELDERIMSVIESKIRVKINEAKKELKNRIVK